MISKRLSPDKKKIIVTFEIPGSLWAERINLVGDFNDWDEESLPFKLNHQGNWQVELELEIGRRCRFRYLFDGKEWRDDWQADSYVPNPHGSYDAVIIAEL